MIKIPQKSEAKQPFILPLLSKGLNLNIEDISENLVSANYELGRLNGSLSLISNPNLLLQPLIIRESVASSGVENIHTTTEEQLQLNLQGRTAFNSEQKETQKYTQALLRGYEMLLETNKFDLSLILEIQKILEPKISGIRHNQKTVIANSVGKIIYTPPKGTNNILSYLYDWVDFANNDQTIQDPLLKATVLHYQFEAIHPFLDGNGRVGRILFVLYLVFTNRLKYPVLYISGYILQTRTQYYLTLEEVTENKDWSQFINYILKGVVEKSEHTTNTIYNITELKKEFSSILENQLPKINSLQLLDFLFMNPFYTQKSMIEELNLSRNTASKYLRLLLEQDIVDVKDDRKEKIYYNKAYLDLL